MNRHLHRSAARAALLGPLSALLTLSAGCNPMASRAAEPMELQGRWIGMRLSAVESATATTLGVPPTVKGVVVVDLRDGTDTRPIQAGLMPGDVIVAVNGTSIGNLTDLYTLTTKLDSTQPLSIELLRQGQPMMASLAPQFPQQAAPMMGAAPAPAAMPAAANAPAAATAPFAAASPAAPGAAPTHLYCPIDQVHWSTAQVGPDFRCPRCGGALTR